MKYLLTLVLGLALTVFPAQAAEVDPLPKFIGNMDVYYPFGPEYPVLNQKDLDTIINYIREKERESVQLKKKGVCT